MTVAITDRASARPGPLRAVKRSLKSPKGLVLLVLLGLAAIAAPAESIARVGPSIAVAIGAAALVDVVFLRVRKHAWVFPSGAILSGLIVALVLSPEEPLLATAGTAILAIVSKYLFRSRLANVFNPAALALVVSYFVFATGQSWWGALPDLSPVALVLLVVAGLAVVDHVNKLPVVLTFLASYFALFTASAFLGDPAKVAEIFRSPDVNAALFFACFMLDDPPTSPVRYLDQMLFGLVVAVASFAVFQTIGAVYFLLAGLLVGNAFEAWRRSKSRPAARTVEP